MADETPPEPLVPQEVDLRGYGFMPFYGNHLLNSDFHARADDAAWRAGVMLWWASWNQVPAASLPDDDAVLATLAGLRGNKTRWLKVKRAALHGFEKCNDGRLYHAFLAPLAIEAYARRKSERDKRRRYRDARSPGPDLLGDSDVRGTGTETGTGRQTGTVTGTATETGKQLQFVLPPWVPVEEWEGFVEMRKKIRKPLTERAKKLIVDDLQQYREEGYDPGKVLDQSTKKNWQGVFRIKADAGGLEDRNSAAVQDFLKGGRHG